MQKSWTACRKAIAILAVVALAACADTDSVETTDQVQTAAVVVPPPKPKPPTLIGRFACDGSILHPSIDSQIESPIRFWFDVTETYAVTGRLDFVGPPLRLANERFAGRFAPKFDADGGLIGGRMVVSWPHVRDGAPADFQVMRETFVRAGQTINGVGQVIRRTSKHTYLSARVWLDPASHPAAAGFRRATFVTATCFPEIDLPAAPASER